MIISNANWVKRKWGDLVTLEYGKRLLDYRESDGEYVVFGTNGPIGKTNDALCMKPTIIIGRKGAYRGVYYSEEPCSLIDTAFYVVAKTELDMKWAYYALLCQDINSLDSGSAIPSTTREAFYNMDAQIPPLETQKEIAHILGTLDDKIELNRKMNKTLEEIAQALFKHWFIDFEFPNADGKPYKSSGGTMIDSELGPIPQGWIVGKLGDIIELLDYKRIPLNSQERKNRQGTYPYYGATGILDYVDDYLFEGVHLLVGEDGTVQTGDGKPSLQYVWGKFWVNNHAHILIGKGKISVEYLYLLLNTIDIGPYITGAVQPKLSQQNLKSIPCVVPSEHLLIDFKNIIHPVFSQVINNKEMLINLNELKNRILEALI